jgi:hypothetical protein
MSDVNHLKMINMLMMCLVILGNDASNKHPFMGFTVFEKQNGKGTGKKVLVNFFGR